MSQFNKLIEKILNGYSDSNISFNYQVKQIREVILKYRLGD
jgi:hypothetical protein